MKVKGLGVNISGVVLVGDRSRRGLERLVWAWSRRLAVVARGFCRYLRSGDPRRGGRRSRGQLGCGWARVNDVAKCRRQELGLPRSLSSCE